MEKIRSMTGYGKGEYNDGVKNIVAEVKTINNRYSDINIKTPRHLRFYEDNIRKIVKNSISRGRIEVYINIEYISKSDTVITPNMNLALQYKNAIEEVKKSLDINDDVRLDTIIKFQDVLVSKDNSEDEEKLAISVENAVKNAIDKLLLMREV